jgi:hypothetical protein
MDSSRQQIMIEVNLLTPPDTQHSGAAFTNDASLTDLGVGALIEVMADGDQHLGAVAQHYFINASSDPAVIRWRQEVFRDALGHLEFIRDLETIARHGAELQRQSAYALKPQPPISTLLRSRELLTLLIADLRSLAQRVAKPDATVTSAGLRLLVEAISTNFTPDYLDSLEITLQELRFEHGLMARANLTAGNLTSHQPLLEGPFEGRGWRDRLRLVRGDRNRIEIVPRDQAGSETLRELRNEALVDIGGTTAKGLGVVIDFFVRLGRELAWLVGALNLYHRLQSLDLPLCFPEPTMNEGRITFSTLVEPTLSLRTGQRPVANDLDASTRSAIVISGANSGGKTTWLTSVALATLMMQVGLFVCADAFCSDVRTALSTFFPRDEDRALERGRLDDELLRLSQAVNALSEGGLFLLNEPLSSTNEVEACAIATALIDDLRRRNIATIVVTHYPTLARSLATDGTSLRPAVVNNGQRTYCIELAAPPADSSAMDIYERLGGW